jgi:hypothetical protein
MRNIIGLIVGAVAGFAGTGITARIGGMIYPVRADPNIEDRVAQVREAMASAPMEAQLFIVAAFFVGGLVAGLVAKSIARTNWPGMVAAGVLTLAALLVVIVLPLPGWVKAAAVILPLIGGMIGNQLVRSRRIEAAPAVHADI